MRVFEQGGSTVTAIFQRSLFAGTIAAVIAAMTYGGVSAAEKKKAEPRPPACTTMKDEATCEAREDCTWRSASVNPKTGKETRRASCAAKPKAKAKSKAKSKAGSKFKAGLGKAARR